MLIMISEISFRKDHKNLTVKKYFMVSSSSITSGGKSHSKQPTFCAEGGEGGGSKFANYMRPNFNMGEEQMKFIFCKFLFTVSLLKEGETNYLKIAQTKSIRVPS